MQGVCLFGWDAGTGVWRKILINAEGKLIIDPTEIFEDTPTDNEHGKAPTSNWAYDHAADPDAHHTKTTSAEIDHGSIQGLADDDHTQYLNIVRHDTTTRHPLSVLDPAVCSESEANSKIATHKADASAHHTRYTDAEACNAWHVRSTVLQAGSWHNLNWSNYNRVYLVPTTGTITIYSINAGSDGQRIEFVVPVSSYTITIKHNYTADGSEKRIMCANSADNTIAAGHVAVFCMVYYASSWNMSQVVS